MKNRQLPNTLRGVTLIELVVSLAILVILLNIAIPSFRSAIASSALKSATNDLVTSIAQTRSTAIRVGRRATMCRSENATQCAVAGDWQVGWIIFSDLTRAGATANIDTGDTINFVYPAVASDIKIMGAAGFTQYISFSPDGQGKTNTGASLLGKIRVCSTSSALTDATRARDLVVNFSGRVVLETPSVASNCPAPS
ncbi:GspH/FimT family pseudopilin [Rhodoferax sp.]|uniref:GspH/FimT family pseudopilin n=1 Tax=Rhodoferax sp. TaxID=50421 RepID=UPI00344D8F49